MGVEIVLHEHNSGGVGKVSVGKVLQRVRADGRATHAMYVFKVKAPQQSKSRYDVYDLIETIPPEAAFRPLDQGGCPLVK